MIDQQRIGNQEKGYEADMKNEGRKFFEEEKGKKERRKKGKWDKESW